MAQFRQSHHHKLAPSRPLTTRVSIPVPQAPLIAPPLSLDLGLLLISIGVVNLWKARQNGNAG